MMTTMVSVSSIIGFVFGALTVLAVEAIVVVYVIHRLTQRSKSTESTAAASPPQHLPDPHQFLPSLCQKQGVLWILEPEKNPNIPALAEQTRKRDMLEVSPDRKLARIKDRMLILTEPDGSLSKIMLKGCRVVAVSATCLPTRKWAKRYPIKVESKTAGLYHGSKVLYIYAETSWEKESWCKALRLVSSDDGERLHWFSTLHEEFRKYLRSLSEGYPYLTKPSAGYHGGPSDKANRLDEPPSKVRQFWRKLSRRTSVAAPDEKRIGDKSRVSQDPVSAPSIKKTAVSRKISNESVEDSSSVSSSAFSHSGSSTHVSETSDADAPEKFVVDEGTLCWNLLLSRLFFDAKSNSDIKTALKARIQRTLSNMRTPSYIGEVVCTGVDPGDLPPYIHGMRAVPTDMNDLWAFEMDIEYSGGVVLYIEVRLEMRELDFHNGTADPNIESSSVGEVTTDLLEEFKHLREELRISDGVIDSTERTDADPKLDKVKSSKTGVSTASSGSRWKSLLNSVAKHVSQVPLTLAIRVATLRGTIQLHIKPPPSDQLWFGFTSMPDVQFQLESSVGDHKITSGRIASFLINRFKASIRETLVLPNCESACVSWMLSEKDDWVPRSAAPLLWLNREAPSEPSSSNEMSSCPQSNNGQKAGDKDQESKQVKNKKVDSLKLPIRENGEGVGPSSILRSSSEGSVSSHDLRAPLLQNEEARCSIQRREENPECQSPSRYVSLKEQRDNIEDDDAKPRRGGRKARMLDLGKKMSEKIEEKRRHIEEKSRHIVEKMRGP